MYAHVCPMQDLLLYGGFPCMFSAKYTAVWGEALPGVHAYEGSMPSARVRAKLYHGGGKGQESFGKVGRGSAERKSHHGRLTAWQAGTYGRQGSLSAHVHPSCVQAFCSYGWSSIFI